MSEHGSVTGSVKVRLRELAEPARVDALQRFFRTGKGGYGEGDRFLAVRVPAIRGLVREYRGMSPADCSVLLHSPWHEERLFALLMLADVFKRGDGSLREAVYRLYMDSTSCVNNWDLVDTSAPHIAGAWLFQRERTPLYGLAVSENIWERRIAIVATQHFIRRDDPADTLHIACMLLNDREDLIHKATGWMLREVGNRDMAAEEGFLREHYRDMPRTMLRYALEKFPREKRRAFMEGRV